MIVKFLLYHIDQMQYAYSLPCLISMIYMYLHDDSAVLMGQREDDNETGVKCDNDNHVTLIFFSARHSNIDCILLSYSYIIMTTTRPRPASPNGAGPSSKKTKTSKNQPTSVEYINNVTSEKLQEYRETYLAATPYRHAVVKDFLSDELVCPQSYDSSSKLMSSSKES